MYQLLKGVSGRGGREVEAEKRGSASWAPWRSLRKNAGNAFDPAEARMVARHLLCDLMVNGSVEA